MQGSGASLVVMRIESKGRYIRATIDPGEYYCTGEPAVISTLLGSCIAACLYDPARRIIGMNHFLLANQRYSRTLPLYASEAGRYGIHAMELLINGLLARGARRERLQAKVFGGAAIMRQTETESNFTCVGQVNCQFILDFLETERIPLVAQDLGGQQGRVIHFSNGDFSVYLRRIDSGRSQRLAVRDRDCWLKAIELQVKSMPGVDLW